MSDPTTLDNYDTARLMISKEDLNVNDIQCACGIMGLNLLIHDQMSNDVVAYIYFQNQKALCLSISGEEMKHANLFDDTTINPNDYVTMDLSLKP